MQEFMNLTSARLSLSYLNSFYRLWPKRHSAETTHLENWPKRPTYQGRNDPPIKLDETTRAETTQIPEIRNQDLSAQSFTTETVRSTLF